MAYSRRSRTVISSTSWFSGRFVVFIVRMRAANIANARTRQAVLYLIP